MKRFILPILAITAIASANLHAADNNGTWTLAGNGSWDTAGNWSGNTIADGSGFTATFGPIAGTAGTYVITVDTARTIGGLSFPGDSSNTHHFTLSGSQTLTLAGASTPTISVALPSRTVTISTSLDSNQGISYSNTGSGNNLIVSGDNIYTGVTTITGAVTIGSNTALGTTGTGNETTLATSATLFLASGVKVTGETVTLGSTSGTTGSLQTASGSAEWAGNVKINTSARIGTASGTQLTVSGVISNGTSNTLTISGTGTTILSGANTYTGNTTFYRGTLKLDGGDNRLPTATLLTMGGTTNNSTFNLNGFNQQFVGLAHSGSTAGTRTVTNDSATGSILTLSGSSDRSFLGNGTSTTAITGNLSLVKAGTYQQTLADANSYTGNTTINAGTLVLSDNSTMTFFIEGNGVNNGISGSGGITLNGDFIFDLSGASLDANNSWNIISVGTLAATFDTNFTVQGFTESGNVWIKDDNSNVRFSEVTGVLSVVPEPSTAFMFLGGISAVLLILRRRRLA